MIFGSVASCPILPKRLDVSVVHDRTDRVHVAGDGSNDGLRLSEVHGSEIVGELVWIVPGVVAIDRASSGALPPHDVVPVRDGASVTPARHIMSPSNASGEHVFDMSSGRTNPFAAAQSHSAVAGSERAREEGDSVSGEGRGIRRNAEDGGRRDGRGAGEWGSDARRREREGSARAMMGRPAARRCEDAGNVCDVASRAGMGSAREGGLGVGSAHRCRRRTDRGPRGLPASRGRRAGKWRGTRRVRARRALYARRRPCRDDDACGALERSLVRNPERGSSAGVTRRTRTHAAARGGCGRVRGETSRANARVRRCARL